MAERRDEVAPRAIKEGYNYFGEGGRSSNVKEVTKSSVFALYGAGAESGSFRKT